jgi:uncharacterized membrane protein
MFQKLKEMVKGISKKGMTLNDAPAMIIVLVVIGIVGAIGLSVITGVGGSFAPNSAAANATDKITESVTNFFALAPVLGTVLIAVVLLAAVFFLYAYTTRNR